MGYNRFYLSLILQVILIVLLSIGFVYFIFETGQVTTALFFLVLLALVTGRLIYYLNRTNRLLGTYFTYLNENDPTLAWSSKYVERNFRGLRISLQGIMEELKKARIENEIQARYLQTIVDNIDAGVITINSSGKIQLMNKAATRLLNASHILNIADLDRIHEQLGSKMKALLPGRNMVEKFIVNGQLSMLSVKATKMVSQGEEYTIFTLHDIRSQMEEQEINSWKKLIRVITHEIMNSITPITTLTLAIRKKLTGTHRGEGKTEIRNGDIDVALSSTKIIEERSKGLIHFIDKYRKITKLPPLTLTTCDIPDLFERIRLLFDQELQKKNIELLTEIYQTKAFKGDPQLVEQVLINLVKNSIEAFEGQPHPQIILKSLNDKDQRTVISVTDNGVGIPEENLEEIFVPFFTTKEEGSGIGLNVCRQIMQLHRGEIFVTSEEDRGTTVSLIF